MGFAVAAAATVVVSALAVSGFGVTGEILDDTARIHAAQVGADERAQHLRDTALIVSDARFSGGKTTATVRNSGSVVLHVDELTFIIDGDLVTPTTTSVEGNAQDTWAPQQDLVATFSEHATQRFAVFTADGVGGYWRF